MKNELAASRQLCARAARIVATSALCAAAAGAQTQKQIGAKAAATTATQNVSPAAAQIAMQSATLITRVLGLDVNTATNRLAWTKLPITQVDSIMPGVPAGVVVAQRPNFGTAVSSARAETLVVSRHAAAISPKAVSVKVIGGVAAPPAAPVDTATATPPTYTAVQKHVPDLYGRTRALAYALLKDSLLSAGTIAFDSADDVAAGLVFRQHPAPGTVVRVRTPVAIWFSVGPHRAATLKTVPDIRGLQLTRAIGVLASQSLRIGHADTLTSSGADGSIVRQSPDSGAQAHPGDAVDVTITVAPRQVTVPELRKRSRAQAIQLLIDSGLVVGRIDVIAGNAVDSIVVRQQPRAGTVVDVGARVDFTEMRPPTITTATVPNLSGMSRDSAERRLARDSLVLGEVVLQNEGRSPTVVAQDPPAGVTVRAGQRVNVTLIGVIDSVRTTTTTTTNTPATPPASRITLAPVPSVVGMRLGEARSTLTIYGFTRLTVSGDSVTSTAQVIAQSPDSGTLVRPNTPVTVRVAFVPGTPIPSLIDQRERDAFDAARAANFRMVVQQRLRGMRLTERVIRQTPVAGTRDRGDSEIDVDMGIPLVPPVPAALALGLVGATAWRIRRPRADRRTDPRTPPNAVQLALDPPRAAVPVVSVEGGSIVRATIAYTRALDVGAWQSAPASGSLIKTVEQSDD